MLKKFFVLFIVGILAFSAAGCSLFGDDDDDNYVGGTVVKTVIKKPVAASGGESKLSDLRAGIRAEVTTTEVVTGAVVTLTLSDGSTFNMTDNGNGEYTATVGNLSGAAGFVIEARKGDLLVQNMVTDLATTGLSSTIESNHLTTAFAQVAISAANVLKTQTGVEVASLQDLIKKVTSISIDYSELKRQVTDENDVVYKSSREIVTVALKNSNTGATDADAGASLLEKILTGNFSEVSTEVLGELNTVTGLTITQDSTTNVWTEKVTTPLAENPDIIPMATPEEDKVAVNNAATTYLNAFIKKVSGQVLQADEQASLSAVLSDDFTLNGMTKTVLLNSQPGEDDDLERFDGSHSLVKVDDNTYLIHIVGTAYMKTGGSIYLNSAVEGYSFSGTNPTEFRLDTLESNISEFPILVIRQSDNSWKISGNRIKVDEVDIELQFAIDLNNSRQFTQFWIQLDDTTAFPVQSVTVTGANLPEAGVSLSKDATMADSNAWHYWNTPTTGTKHTSPYPFQGWDYTAVNHAAGSEYKFSVTFTDGSVQNFIHKIPTIPTGYGPFSVSGIFVTPANGKLALTWPKNTNTTLFDSYYISVWNQTDGGDGRVLESGINDINTVTASFDFNSTSYNLLPEKQYSVNIHSELKNGLAQHAFKNFTVPDPTEEAAVGFSKALDAGLKNVIEGAALIPPPVITYNIGGSLRSAVYDAYAGLGLPDGTQFHTTYTSYAPMSGLVNVFSLPTTVTSIVHQLLQFKDAAGNIITYNPDSAPAVLSAAPASMSMLVVFQNTTAGLAMQLGMQDYPLITDSFQYLLPFEAVGTISVALGTDNYEVRVEATVDVRRDGETTSSSAQGGSLNGEIYKNGQRFQIEDMNGTLQNAYIKSGVFNATGLTGGYIYAGETNPVAMLERVEGILYLKIMGSDGNIAKQIPVQ